MSRFDEDGRKLVVNKVNTLYRIDSHKEGETYITEVGAEGTNIYSIAIDLETGKRSDPDSSVISPNYEALTNMGIYDQSISDAYHAMIDECFDVYSTIPYNEAVEALNDDII